MAEGKGVDEGGCVGAVPHLRLDHDTTPSDGQ